MPRMTFNSASCMSMVKALCLVGRLSWISRQSSLRVVITDSTISFSFSDHWRPEVRGRQLHLQLRSHIPASMRRILTHNFGHNTISVVHVDDGMDWQALALGASVPEYVQTKAGK